MRVIVSTILLLLALQPALAQNTIVLSTTQPLAPSYIQLLQQNASKIGVKISVNKLPYDSLKDGLKRGNGPDLMLLSYAEALNTFNSDFLLPVSDFNKGTSLVNDLKWVYPSLIRAATVQGKLIGVPQSVVLRGIVYNSKSVSDCGIRPTQSWKWDTFSVITRKLLQFATPLDGVYYRDDTLNITVNPKMSFGFVIPIAIYSWAPFIWSSNGSLGKANTPPSIEAFRFLASLASQGTISPWLSVSVVNELTRGWVLMAPETTDIFVSSQQTLNVPKAMLSNATNQFEILPYPASPSGKNVGDIWRLPLYVINKKTKFVSEVAQILSSSLSNELQQALIQTGTTPVSMRLPLPKGKETIPFIAQNAYIDDPGAQYINMRKLINTSDIYRHTYDFFSGRILVDDFVNKIQIIGDAKQNAL